MPRAESLREDGHFVLAAWCTASKAWHEQPGEYESAWQAQDAATERGIYRVTYVRKGRRLDMEPFVMGEG